MRKPFWPCRGVAYLFNTYMGRVKLELLLYFDKSG
jgi:hypothetical protein